MTRLLLVDDDVELCRMLAEYLAGEDLQTVTVHDGDAALAAAQEGDFDAVVLDVMLPGRNGFEVLRELRKTVETPVLMLTARGDDVDTIVGLELGADDYLSKPTNPRVLVARLRALLRRTRTATAAAGQPLRVVDLLLHEGTRRVTVGGTDIDLTGAEFALLATLIRHAGSPVEKNQLCRQALGRDLHPFDRSIDVHVANLRRKLGPLSDGSPRIKIVRGAGYQLVQPWRGSYPQSSWHAAGRLLRCFCASSSGFGWRCCLSAPRCSWRSRV